MNPDFRGKRVLMLVENSSYPEDGRIYHEATALVEAGYQVSVICQSRPDHPWHEVKDGVYIFRYPYLISGKGLISYLWEYTYSLVAMFILSILAFVKPGFDYIHAANPPDTAVFIAAFYKLFRKRFVFDHHDLSPEIFQVKYGAQKKINRLFFSILVTLEKISCSLADHIIATNQSYKIIESKRDGVPLDRITVVRNGPDTDRIRPVQPSPELIGRAKAIFAYLGSMAKQDGVDHLLRALQELDRKFGYRDWFCVLIGPADDMAGLQKLAGDLGLAERTWFTGYLPNESWMPLLSAVDIGIEPAPANPLNEASTMAKLMAYMALVKPSVAYDLPEHRVTAGDSALYAIPNDEADLARQLVTLIENPDLRDKLGAIGRQKVVTELDWKYQKEPLLSAYRSIAPEPP